MPPHVIEQWDGPLFAAIRRPRLQRRPNALSRATGFLHSAYKDEFFYWELVVLTYRVTLTGLVNLTVDTLAVGPAAAFAVMLGYALLACALVLGLQDRNVRTRWW